RNERLEAQAARQRRERDLSQAVVADSPEFREVIRIVEEVGRSEVNTILIQGESGTGKNVLARHVHSVSARRRKPIIEVSCASIPDTLLDSEILGHERGAFTDAKATRRGAFELADGGTVVLDEVGELKLELQAKLLQVLEERRLRRIGGSREIDVDVRVIALTNRDLPKMTRSGEFRQDLFYRLNVFPITVPPLRDHAADILPLARHFLDLLGPRLGRTFESLSRKAENLLLGYSWPGNIRELRNVLERAMVLDRGPCLEASFLILDQLGVGAPDDDPGTEALPAIAPLEEVERRMVRRAMSTTGNNQTRAAELLGISRDQLRYRLKKLGSEPD
ncbi:MAG: sigma 54-interacting transcriptional regulator, partial [Acidobacteriota bacterium]|nr:sigma 54-interacting transcriptional regulator [Acidobacteriota bacterium]